MVTLKIIELQREEIHELTTGDTEMCIVILAGKCSININLGEYIWNSLGNRNSVFEGTPDSVYVPCKCNVTIIPERDNLRIAVVSTESSVHYEPFVIPRESVTCEIRGTREWKRSVYDILTTDHNVNSLIVGETIHTDGVWSGYPPHKHDTDNANEESKNSEVYYVELEPQNAFAVFVQYGDDWEKATILRNQDSVVVENGYHAVVSAGGAKFYYLWALDSSNHRFICKADEEYKWVK